MKTIFYKRVKYCFHHEKIKFKSSSHRVIFFLLYSFNAKSGKWRHRYLHYCNSVIYVRSFIDDVNFETADGQVPHWWSEYIIVQSFTYDLTSFPERRRSGKPTRGATHDADRHVRPILSNWHVPYDTILVATMFNNQTHYHEACKPSFDMK